MSRPTDEQLLAFLEGELEGEQLTNLLEQLERDPELARELRSAAVGLSAVQASAAAAPASGPAPMRTGRRGVRPWWMAVAAAATLVITVPSTLWLSSPRQGEDGAAGVAMVLPDGVPTGADPGFVLVLHGRWPDAAGLEEIETRRRATEYWAWASSLAETTVLMAAGDLRWEPGMRLGPNGSAMAVAASIVESPDFVVGMFALRVRTYEEAMAIARECPHLRYGGSVSVRSVASGFFTGAGSVGRATDVSGD